MSTKGRKLLLWLLLIPMAVVVAVIGLVAFSALRPLPPIPPLPADNGHDDIVNAAQMLPDNEGDYSSMSKEDLRALVAKNSAALKLARTGLEKQCRMPLDFSADSTSHMDQLKNLKRLTYAFAAEARLAGMEDRFNDAAKSCLDTIHLGTESVRGGVVMDQLVGTAIEMIGISQLTNLVDHLDAKACRETAASLEAFDAQRQTWAEVLQQEQAWSRRTFSGPRYALARMMTGGSVKKALEGAGQKNKEQLRKSRQLLIELAARTYELEKGNRPSSLSDLVPDYLKAIPQDPVTGTNMVYSP